MELVLVIAALVVVGGTFALGIWALRHLRKQFPKGKAPFEQKPGEQSTIESKTTWLSGGGG